MAPTLRLARPGSWLSSGISSHESAARRDWIRALCASGVKGMMAKSHSPAGPSTWLSGVTL